MLCLAFLSRNSDSWLQTLNSPYSGSTVFFNNIQLTPQLFDLLNTSQESILNSLAPHTLSAYLSGWNRFKSFHTLYQLQFPSLDVTILCLSILKIRTSTIQTYLSGISVFFKIVTGSCCLSISHSHIPMILKGCKKARTFKRYPATATHSRSTQ